MLNLKYTYLFWVFLFCINTQFIDAQDLTEILADEVTKTLTSGSNARKDEERFTSFIQNEYQNTVKQLKKIDKDIEQTLFQTNLQRERIKIASQLCSLDPRACFLIEEYQTFQEQNIPQSIDELEIYGVDYFTGYPIEMNAFDNLPMQDDYIISIGDYINVSSFGILNFDEEIEVDLTGNLLVPQIGLVKIAGMNFLEAQKKVSELVNSKFPSTEIYLSLNQVRAIQVFTMGVVNKPGSYAVSSMSTGVNAIITGGGFQRNASLRNISIVRGNQIVANIDLYKLLIKGDSSSDTRLKNGDTVLVHGSKNRVSVFGEVHRPAIYEFLEGESVQDAIDFALGFTSFADEKNIIIKRVVENNKIDTLSIKDLVSFKLKAGDEIIINTMKGESLNNLVIKGELRNVGQYSINGKSSLGDFISIERDLLENTYTGLAIIKHYSQRTRSWSIQRFNLLNQGELNEIEVHANDQVFIFSKEEVEFINSLTFLEFIQKIYNQDDSLDKQSQESVSIASSTVVPSSLLPNLDMNIDDFDESYDKANQSELLRCFNFFGRLNDSSFIESAFTKIQVFNPINKQTCPDLFTEIPELLPVLFASSIPVLGNVRVPGLYPVDENVSASDILEIAGGSLDGELDNNTFEAGFKNSEIRIIAFDQLSQYKDLSYFSSKVSYKISEQGFVTLKGQFKFPGKYAIDSSTTLMDIYERAGFLTHVAFPYGAILARESIKEIEQDSLERAERELAEVLSTAVTSGYLKQNSTDLISLLALMTSISNADPIGRLVSEFDPNTIRQNPSLNIKLEDGDVIYMPSLQNTVTVMGQVLNPVTVPFNPNYKLKDYIISAGGFKDRADDKKAYAILPNGISIDPANTFLGFSSGSNKIVPGTTIIVPRKARPLDGLSMVEVLTPILANLSVTAASIAAINN